MCMFVVLLFFTHPPSVGTLSRIIRPLLDKLLAPQLAVSRGPAFDAVTLVSFAACR